MRIVVVIVLLTAAGISHANEPPSALSNVDRLDLKSIVSELRAIDAEIRLRQMEIDALKQSARSVLVARDAICKRYQIDPAMVGKTVGVDLEGTGKIVRSPPFSATEEKK